MTMMRRRISQQQEQQLQQQQQQEQHPTIIDNMHSSSSLIHRTTREQQPRRRHDSWFHNNHLPRRQGLLRQVHVQLLCVLLVFSCLSRIPLVQSQESLSACNPLQIYVYDSEEACQTGDTPSAVGNLYADGTCRATVVESSQNSEATYLLPGRYVAECIPDSSGGEAGMVRFLQSGCTSSDCTSSAGEQECDRDFTEASFYARNDIPEYEVQVDPNDNRYSCLTLGSEEATIVFAFFGNCLEDDANACNGDAPTPTVPTDPTPTIPTVDVTKEPSQAPVEEPDPPTEEPTPEPTRRPSRPDPTPTTEPVTSPEPSNSPAPTVAPPTAPTATEPTATNATEEWPPTDAPSTITSGTKEPSSQGGGGGETPSIPNTNFTTTSPNDAAATADSNSGIGIIVGAVMGALLALTCVLVAGFLAGSVRQKQKQSRNSQNNMNSPNSGANLHDTTTWIPAAAGFTTSKEITVDANWIRQDDISTLGPPMGVRDGDGITVLEDGTVAQNSLAWDWSKPHPQPEPSVAEDTATYSAQSVLFSSDGNPSRNGRGGVKSHTLMADESSFEKLYHDDDEKEYDTDFDDEDPTETKSGSPGKSNTSSAHGVRFSVTVPSGRLGMVIDNTPGSVPEVRALKPDSVLVARGVLVGDYLEQVDGLDVRDWTCLQVSQMIQQKSNQASRELVFFRKGRHASSSGAAVYTINEL